MSALLLDKILMLEKFPGKGGWTFVRLPEIKTPSGKPLGWDKVRALFDDFEVSEMGLLSLGNGQRFLPVKSQIRKSIGKQAGDQIRLQLFARIKELDVRAEFLLCLEDDPEALTHFQSWKAQEREKYISWIEQAQNTEQQVERMAQAVDRIAAGLFFTS
ncbi:YdeI/OmpD-associated family protein [Pedobacter nyackensis]|uniref:Bacteriocin-protection, YdeI or OmpD-Associated n=1 Tax=Pedobacter nyackensis TaxID=475255 RepID=A0A1W2F0R0_9SPHI|nr:YdeI/OmpD-associated family protein [Pedobacter nyackensis]SMD15048.1 Bacteriocin-protection, YdeI or OmpD-Associated [Pedobacter nyackensis]